VLLGVVNSFTEVQRVSFVGCTGGEGGSPRLWNLQNLHAVPPYSDFCFTEVFFCIIVQHHAPLRSPGFSLPPSIRDTHRAARKPHHFRVSPIFKYFSW